MPLRYAMSSDGFPLYYLMKQAKRECLYFLHGWPHNHTAWSKEADYLHKKGFAIISQDLRGNGKSGSPERLEQNGFRSYADDIETIRKAERKNKIVLIGHSFGGMVALSYYHYYPLHVRALVLVDTLYENPVKHIPFFARTRAIPLMKHLLRFMLGNMHTSKKHLPYVDFTKLSSHHDIFCWLQGARETQLKSILAILYEMLGFDEKSVLRDISVPTLVIEGQRDKRTPEADVRKMFQSVKHAKLVIVPDAGHDTNIRNPFTLEHFIGAFLDKVVEKQRQGRTGIH